MKKFKSCVAIALSLAMTVCSVNGLDFANAKAEGSNVVSIDASKIGNLSAIKAQVFEGLSATGEVSDYEYFYNYSFDANSVSGVITPGFIFNDGEVDDYFGNGGVIASSVKSISDSAYDAIHTKFVNFAASSDVCQTIAENKGVTAEEFAESVFPAGDEGKEKFADVLGGSYWTLMAGYQNANADDDSDLDKESCVAYIPFEIEGVTFDKTFGIALPEISAGTWNVRMVSKADGSVAYEGTVEIAKNDVTITAAADVQAGASAFELSDEACDTIQVYVGIENCDVASVNDLGANADNLFVSVILPESIKDFEITGSYKSENVGNEISDAIASFVDEKTVEDILASIDNKYDGAGEAISSFINSYSDGLTNATIKVDEYPSATGVYYGAAVAFDKNYADAYETSLYVIADDATVYTVEYNEEDVDGMLTTASDLGASVVEDEEISTFSVFVGKNLEGNGNAASYLDKVDSEKAKVVDLKNKLNNGELPADAVKVINKVLGRYDLVNDDDIVVAFLSGIAAETTEGFDIADYGFYTNEEDVIANGCGEYLQFTMAAMGDGYIALPISRVFTLTEEIVPTSIELNLEYAEVATLETLELVATVNPDAADTTVTWTSSNDKIASVDEDGVVTAHIYGKVVITATTVNGLTAECEVQTKYYDVNGTNIKGDADYQYFYNPVYWAADNGITRGYKDVYFGPERNCERREMMIFLWRMAGCPTGYGDARDYFNDMKKGFDIESASNQAIAWGYKTGIVVGYPDGGFHPEAPVTRLESLIMLYRFAGKPETTQKVIFKDVLALKANENSATYKSIAWATENNITAGYPTGGFGPNLNCLREHIVTFLYRYNNMAK